LGKKTEHLPEIHWHAPRPALARVERAGLGEIAGFDRGGEIGLGIDNVGHFESGKASSK